MGDPGRLVGGQAPTLATLEELGAEAALPDTRLSHDPDDLRVAIDGALEGRLERGHLVGAPDELREAAGA